MRGRVVPGRVPDGVRPTASRVREALFSMLGQDLGELSLLDAFGGTGLLSFEAASRGATVTCVERHRGTARQIEAAARALGVRLDLRQADARTVFRKGTWDMVLLDPPYDDDGVAWATAAAGCARLALVLEARSGVVLPASLDGLVLDRERRYGDTTLAIWRRSEQAEVP